jgi:predicted nucleic acid-binding protein
MDASLTLAWSLHDEDHPLADLAFEKLRFGSALVPAIWWYEVRNVLILNERRGRNTPDRSEEILRDLQRLRIVVEQPSDEARIMSLARQYRLTVYDAAYLALSLREQLPLATLDSRLDVAARAAGIPPLE